MRCQAEKPAGGYIQPNIQTMKISLLARYKQSQHEKILPTMLPEKVCAVLPWDLDHLFSNGEELSYTKPAE